MTSLTGHHIHTEDDVEGLWRALMDPLGFHERTLHVVLITGDEPLPAPLAFDDLPGEPEPEDEGAFADLLTSLRDHLGVDRVSGLVSRPGLGAPDATDVAWIRLFRGAAARAGLAVGVTYLATDLALRPVHLDDLD